MSDDNRTSTEKILDLLLDALQERQQARQTIKSAQKKKTIPEPKPGRVETAVAPTNREPVQASVPSPPAAQTAALLTQEADTASITPEIPQKLPSIHLEHMLTKLIVLLVILIIVVNIPFNRFGTSLARAMPDSAALIVRDGLIIKGSGNEIYVLETNQKRWISTIDAFEWYGYRWDQVREVEDAFLDQFENGRPIYLLLKCSTSPHVYALENGQKRWIKDIPTFNAQGFVWDDIKFVPCSQLRNMPDGVPMPPDAGPPPQPE